MLFRVVRLIFILFSNYNMTILSYFFSMFGLRRRPSQALGRRRGTNSTGAKKYILLYCYDYGSRLFECLSHVLYSCCLNWDGW